MKFKPYYKLNCFALVIILTLLIIPNAHAQWVIQNSGTTRSLLSVHFLNPDIGYVSGEYGTILKTTDGGVNWQTLSPGTNSAFDVVLFTDENTGYLFGRGVLILKTIDAGNSWFSLNYSGSTTLFNSAYFTSIDTGYAVGGTNNVGGTIFKTTDAGNSWSPQTAGTYQWLRSVYFTDPNTGYVVGGGGTILKTTDGGTTWIALNTETNSRFTSVHFPDADTGYTVTGWPSDGGIFKTINAGTSWSFQDPGTTESLNVVFFVDVNIGYIVGDSGIILKGINEGTSSVEDMENSIIRSYTLHQNHPNPFNPTTTIQYELPQRSNVQITIYDLIGRKVTTLLSETQDAGFKSVTWNETNNHGKPVSAGVYLYQIRVYDPDGVGTGDFVQTKKMVLLK